IRPELDAALMAISPGSPPGRAPTKLLTILGDQPIGRTAKGEAVFADMTLVQMLQRIISYLGQPGSATGGVPTGGTLTSGVAAAAALAALGAFGPRPEVLAASFTERISGFPANGPS